jgi:glycosyltransferase involved in cell wall biosynthesis
MKICIVIPAHNEEKRIGKTLEVYSSFFEKKRKDNLLDYQILIVINNTSDRTEQIVKRYQRHNAKIRCLVFKQGGKGFAITQGFQAALTQDFDAVGFVDADLATSPEAFYDLILHLDGYDGVIASRWLSGSKILTPQTQLRRFLSRGFNFLVRTLFLLPYRDTQCGAKIFKRKALEHSVQDLTVTRWAFDIDLLYIMRKKGFYIQEIPTVWEDQRESKLNVKTVPLQMFLAILRLRMLHSPFKRLIQVYDQLPERFKIHHTRT